MVFCLCCRGLLLYPSAGVCVTFTPPLCYESNCRQYRVTPNLSISICDAAVVPPCEVQPRLLSATWPQCPSAFVLWHLVYLFRACPLLWVRGEGSGGGGVAWVGPRVGIWRARGSGRRLTKRGQPSQAIHALQVPTIRIIVWPTLSYHLFPQASQTLCWPPRQDNLDRFVGLAPVRIPLKSRWQKERCSSLNSCGPRSRYDLEDSCGDQASVLFKLLFVDLPSL